MKLLALSDTHGDFSQIDKLVRKHGADAVIHSGDFSFLSYEDLETFPGRELSLNIKHWKSVPEDIRKRAMDLSRETKIELSKEYRVLGDIDHYLDGTEEFEVPVYVTWGNHENMQMIKQFLSGEKSIPNLHLVTHEGVELTEKLSLFGIGGNFTLRNFFNEPYSDHFYPYMTYEEWARLYTNVRMATKAKKNIWMMTHVSPGKEPLLELFSTKIKAQVWFSGHMGAPMPQQYTLFSHLDDADFVKRLQLHVDYARDAWKKTRRTFEKRINDSSYPPKNVFSLLKGAEHLFDMNIKHEPTTRDNYHTRKRSVVVKGTHFINLPDVPDGYVLLESDDSKHFSVVSYGRT